MTPSDTPPVGGDWVLVPRVPAATQLAGAILTATWEDPSAADMAITGAVLELLPPTGHPDARAVIADMARDYRAMLSAAPPPPVGDREAVARIIDPDAWTDRATFLALMWRGQPAPAFNRAAEVVAPSIAKADAILRLLGLSPSLSPGELEGTSLSVADSAGARCEATATEAVRKSGGNG